MAEEKQYENKVKKYLESIGIPRIGASTGEHDIGWYLKIWGNRYMPKGLPDMFVVIHGRFYAIELKANKGRLTQLQKDKIEQINNTGGEAIVARPRDYEDFVAWVESKVNNV